MRGAQGKNMCQFVCFRLFVLSTAMFLGACASNDKSTVTDAERQAFDDLRSEIREVVDEPGRATEAIALVDSMSDDLRTLRSKIADRRQRVMQLNADYDVSRADFKAFAEEVDAERRESRRKVLDDHHALLALVTPEEWAVISRSHTRAMKAMVKTLQAI